MTSLKPMLCFALLLTVEKAPAQTAAPVAAQVASHTHSAPALSRDGKRIVYVESDLDQRGRSVGKHLRLVNSDGTGQRNLADGDDYRGPRFSPDGQWIVFTQLKKGGFLDVWLVGTDGNGLKQLTNNDSYEQDAVFSSDAKFIYFRRSSAMDAISFESLGGTPMRLSLADGSESKLFAEEMRVQNIAAAPAGNAYVRCLCKVEGGKLVVGPAAVMLISSSGAVPRPLLTFKTDVFKLRTAQDTVRFAVAGLEFIDPFLLASKSQVKPSEKSKEEDEEDQTAWDNYTAQVRADVQKARENAKSEIRLMDGTKDERLIADAGPNRLNFDLSADGKWLVFAGRPSAQQPLGLWLYDVEKKSWSLVNAAAPVNDDAQATARKHYENGVKFGQANRLDDAIAEFSEAIKLMPNEPLFFRNRGLAYAFKNDLAGALKDYAEVIRLAPNIFDAYAERGGLLAQANRTEEAVVDFTAAIRLAPNNKQLYLDRAQLYRKLGKTPLAVADESKAASLP